MAMDTILWIALFAVLAGFGVAFAVPSSRPYAKKYWWIFLVAAGAIAGFLILRRRPGNSIDDSRAEGKAMVVENTHVIDQLVDAAHEKKLLNDVEHKRKLLEAEEPRKEFDAKLEAIETVDNSMERRKALIKLVETS